MRKPSHYTKANMLWSTTAYCDQWNKVMAIYDKNDHLRIVIAFEPVDEGYDVLLIGDDEKLLLTSYTIKLGTTKKSTDACFKLHYYLEDEYNPKFMPTTENKQIINVCEVLVHSRSSAIKHGGFKTCDDASKEIDAAVASLKEAKNTMEQFELFENYDYYV